MISKVYDMLASVHVLDNVPTVFYSPSRFLLNMSRTTLASPSGAWTYKKISFAEMHVPFSKVITKEESDEGDLESLAGDKKQKIFKWIYLHLKHSRFNWYIIY